MILNSKHYPQAMFMLLIIACLMILFTSVVILKDINKILEKRITGYVVENEEKIEINNTLKDNSEVTNNTSLAGAVYSSRSYMLFYIILGSIVVTIIIITLSLRKTIIQNIIEEERNNPLSFIEE